MQFWFGNSCVCVVARSFPNVIYRLENAEQYYEGALNDPQVMKLWCNLSDEVYNDGVFLNLMCVSWIDRSSSIFHVSKNRNEFYEWFIQNF